MLFFDPQVEGCAGCPANLLLVVHDPSLERWRNDVTSYIDTAVIVAVGAVIVRHWWRRTRAARHVIAPILWAAVPAVAYLVTREIADDFVTLSRRGRGLCISFCRSGWRCGRWCSWPACCAPAWTMPASARCCHS